MEKKPVKIRLKSFAHAWNGIRILFGEETNARIHVVIGAVVLLMGLLFNIDRFEWLAILGTIGLVLITEAVNTAIERLSNHVTPERHPQIKVVKDLAAGAVLISAVIAVLVGIIVFGEKIAGLLI